MAEKKFSMFENRQGYRPNLDAPKKFSEKLLKRILEDDDPHYELYGVKLFSHYLVKSRAIDGLRFSRRLKVVRSISPQDFADLPESFIIKSSFGSGLNQLVARKSELDIAATCRKFNMRRTSITNARGNSDEDNVIIFEECLGDPDVGTPDDYKFHCFHGEDGFFYCIIQVDSDRFEDHRQTLFDQDFNPIEMQFKGQVGHDETPARPRRLDDMIRMARDISAGFDYVRVDLFCVKDNIYFGELTPFHQGGFAAVIPEEWEYRLGEIWHQRFPTFQPDDIRTPSSAGD